MDTGIHRPMQIGSGWSPLAALLSVGLPVAVLVLACRAPEPSETRGTEARPERELAPVRHNEPQRCRERNPLRNAYYGALHVHTARSIDAWNLQTRLGPDDAYAFARGEAAALPPLAANGVGVRSVRLERPLDFAAVTDHAEFLGETRLCSDPTSPAYAEARCRRYRGEAPSEIELPPALAPAAGLFEFISLLAAEQPVRASGVCGTSTSGLPAGLRCIEASRGPWLEIQDAAARWNDTSPECGFTTFVAYEYTGMPGYSNLHRNVIFRDARVPALPVGYFDARTPEALWRELRRTCTDAGTGCDVLAIPHNSNLSNGRMFRPDYPGAASAAERRALARERSAIEPLAEIFQHKGDSECRNGFPSIVGEPDELCDFEKWRPETGQQDCGDGTGARGIPFGEGCVSRRDFVRYALTEGLRESGRIGANPFKLGIIAATDTHSGTGGMVDESAYEGHGGVSESSPALRLARSIVNPGGLAGVWAEENSRDALFDAMRRRETFGTSGPRITPRLFGGWSYPDDLCARDDLVVRGYSDGVAMGGDLPARPATGDPSPRLVVSALADPGTDARPGGLLQRLQIIKGWVDAKGDLHQAVYDVAGDASSGAGVDPATCTPTGPGARELCSVWSDPDFDPSEPAYYYARVVENPSCRYTAWDCLRTPAAERPPRCSDPALPGTIQERAWTSPIWYSPS